LTGSDRRAESGSGRLVAEVRKRVAASTSRSVPELRRIRRGLTRESAALSPEVVLGAAERLLADREVPRWLTYELVHHHAPTLASLEARSVRRLGRGIGSWGDVDAFACLVAGPAWREGRVPDAEVGRWAVSPDRWWRRAALVSTVPLNSAARGGPGDARRTLEVCRMLVHDRDDMVVKAMSWALRALSARNRPAVERFLDRHAAALASRVLREVRNKLDTGLKNPPRGRGRAG